MTVTLRPGETDHVEFRGYRGNRATRFERSPDNESFREVVASTTPLVRLVPKERPVLCFFCDWMHPRNEACPGTPEEVK